jgi:hypothetical protein
MGATIRFTCQWGMVALCLVASGRAAASDIPGLYGAWGATNLVTTNSVTAVGAITRIEAGGFHALALRVNGTVAAWGDNNSNQTNVPPGISNIVAIAAGARHNLVLFGTGTVMSWGLSSSSQTNVPPGLNGIAAIAAGADHSVALRTNGTVVTWGVSSGLTNVPVSATNVMAIAAGPSVTLALRDDGTVVAWGTATDSLTNLPPGLTNIAAVSVGLNHCLALRSNGTIVAWGNNTSGQTTVPTQLTNAVKISAGWLHSLARREDGTLIGWGATVSGQTIIPSGLTNVTEFAAGNAWNVFVDVRPRFLTNPPATVVLPNGGGTNLSAAVLSGTEYLLQWQFNGTPIPDATNNSLPIANFDHTQAGIYSLVATNVAASVTAATVVRLSNAPTVLVNGVLIGGGNVARTNSATIALLATTNTYPRLYYTLDGSEPDFTSPQYSSPFVTSNSVILRAVAYNQLVTDKALAAPVNVQVIPTYPLVIVAPGGGVTRVPLPNLSTNSYLSNTLVTLTATASNGWEFMHWTGAASGTNAETTVLMTQSNYVQAVFGTTLNLNTNYPGFGIVTTDPPITLFPYGTVVTLTARPDPGRYFFGWAGLLNNFANPVTITVTNASGLTALFAPLTGNQVSLLVLPVNGGGGIQFSPNRNVYTNGEVVTITAWNSSNRVFSLWLGDAGGTNNPLTLTLDESRLIYAYYDPGVPISQLPVFTQPPAGRSLSPGNSTTLAALATGEGAISYQWRLNNNLLPGATGNQFNLTNLTVAKAGLYDVLASNAFGTVTSPAAPVALFQMELTPSTMGPLPLLVIDCAPGAEFLLQYSSDLRLTNWNLLTPLTTPAARSYFIDAAPTNVPQRFYRLMPQ